MNVLLVLILVTAMRHVPIQRDHLLALVRLDLLEVDCSVQVEIFSDFLRIDSVMSVFSVCPRVEVPGWEYFTI